MPAITDKFGKASIDNNYAIATTVKTTRLPAVTVLEAFDLSKFNPDTPVFVVTYKKTTNPTTGLVSVTDLVSWKAIVNTGANTLTNLTIAPGYVDAGNAVGDFIECIPTSYWENSLIDGILTSLNPNGTLKTSAVQAALGLGAESLNGWNVLAYTPNTIVAQGNRNYLATFNGVDLTGIVSQGFRLKGTRTIAAPTRVGVFNGTSQSLTKAAPNKMTFTDNFTLRVTGRVSNLNNTASTMYFGGRGNVATTSAWGIYVTPAGNVGLSVSVSGGNNKFVQSIKCIPWGEEVKVTATWATGTVVLYIDGVPVDTIVTNAGTPPTNNVPQTGDFAIGKLGSEVTSTWFAGQISQFAVYDAVLTAAQVRALDSTPLAGTETNLKSGYSLDNVITDLNTTTPNDLTNNNGVTFITGGGFCDRGASANLEYGVIVTKPVYSGGNTSFYIQVPEGCMLPVAGTPLSALSYSPTGKPFGFPNDKTRWDIKSFLRNGKSNAFGSINTWHSSAFATYLPLGSWDTRFEGVVVLTSTVSGARNGIITVTDGGTLFPLPVGSANAYKVNNAKRIYAPSGTDALDEICISFQQEFAAAVNLYLYAQIYSASGTESWNLDGQGGDLKFVASNQWI